MNNRNRIFFCFLVRKKCKGRIMSLAMQNPCFFLEHTKYFFAIHIQMKHFKFEISPIHDFLGLMYIFRSQQTNPRSIKLKPLFHNGFWGFNHRKMLQSSAKSADCVTQLIYTIWTKVTEILMENLIPCIQMLHCTTNTTARKKVFPVCYKV